ncbi:MAG: 2-C-methyl-D-erythritol 4-phosphate cytidylyltransferase [Deltaproteobacteria bacterium]|nr:2-C-methyl-D-erythritol 4-phosphate cytidylyltransferase [Deltaproteobacteria bacterium]
MQVNAIILAAGRGTRVGSREPKVLLSVAGRPLILHTLERFRRSREVGKAVLVVPPDAVGDYEAMLAPVPESSLEITVRPGGARRQDSVRAGLDALDLDCAVVLVHDGARPFAAPDLIDRCAREARAGRSVTVAVPARNTIKTVERGQVRETLPRQSLWEIQTPQGFPLHLLRDAYAEAEQEGVEATDDAMLVERLGVPVEVVEGSSTNLKVTYPEDLLYAEALVLNGVV